MSRIAWLPPVIGANGRPLLRDPFQRAGPLRPSTPETTLALTSPAPDDKLHRIVSRGVGLVLIGENGAIATVGGVTLREGDPLDGFRVAKIDLDGIYLVEDALQ